MQRIRIWDWPTRLVHWLIVALVLFSWGSAKYGHMDLHRYSGYTLLGLLLFRLYWGVFGGHTSRFASFVKGPRAVLHYLKSQRDSGSTSFSDPIAQSRETTAFSVGHNPLGALSVVVLLLLLLAQVFLGLFAVDVDGLESGPLSYLVSFDTGRAVAEIHGIVFNVLLGFIGLHLAAVLFYQWVKRDNLMVPMITGGKLAPPDTDHNDVSTSLLHVAVGIVIASAIVWLIV